MPTSATANTQITSTILLMEKISKQQRSFIIGPATKRREVTCQIEAQEDVVQDGLSADFSEKTAATSTEKEIIITEKETDSPEHPATDQLDDDDALGHSDATVPTSPIEFTAFMARAGSKNSGRFRQWLAQQMAEQEASRLSRESRNSNNKGNGKDGDEVKKEEMLDVKQEDSVIAEPDGIEAKKEETLDVKEETITADGTAVDQHYDR
ncbi:hypothetical protein VTN77DRAFT_4763 [Rasamsonia byssochlamydoides]|uniref:uncharacterized protein n=1 Tax=Rasamsonia byssochlamydoides TaxID=89139 RepID=UPI0037446659